MKPAAHQSDPVEVSRRQEQAGRLGVDIVENFRGFLDEDVVQFLVSRAWALGQGRSRLG